jgi:hypothetical protein
MSVAGLTPAGGCCGVHAGSSRAPAALKSSAVLPVFVTLLV